MVFGTTSFEGHWPVGCAAIVEASSAHEAAEKLNKVLQEEHGLPGGVEAKDMQVFPSMVGVDVWVMCDGNY